MKKYSMTFNVLKSSYFQKEMQKEKLTFQFLQFRIVIAEVSLRSFQEGVIPP